MRISVRFAARRLTTASLLSLSVALVACVPDAPGEEQATTTGEPTTSDAPPTTGTSAAPTSEGLDGTTSGSVPGTTSGSSSGTGGDDCGVLCPEDTDEGGCDLEVDDAGGALKWRCTVPDCDVFLQDCPEGMKCAARGDGGGGQWNSTVCTPVTGDGAPGEPCIAEEGLSGADDCRKGAMCWDVDKETQLGTCVELCTGSPRSPICSDEAGSHCTITNDGVLNLCLPVCDPLMQGCASDDLCVPADDNFVCVPDASGEDGQSFDPCEVANACDAGLLCMNTWAATECDPNAGGCCLPFCDLSDPNVACPGAGQSCVPFHEDMPPPGLMNVGVCSLPP